LLAGKWADRPCGTFVHGASASLVAVSVWTLVLGCLVPTADADTQSELDAARDKLHEIEGRFDAQRALLERLDDQLAALGDRVNEGQIRLQRIRSRLADTEAEIAETRERYDSFNDRLGSRIRDIYMRGSVSGVDVVLGAESFGDLLDRIEYSSTLAQADADLITRVQNLRNALVARQRSQTRLVEEQQTALADLRSRMAEMNHQFERQQSIVSAMQGERADAAALVSRFQDELTMSLPAVTTPAATTMGAGPFAACPVGLPRALTDSFGAPRYGGGFHLHEGDDIMAPTGTPIYATFDGTAASAGSELGGISVIVTGSEGWTLNAHLSRLGQLGAVQAGDVIGYVGATGDTTTPHDHFEWHPNVIPTNWPASGYGYSVIGDAVNPYPILAAVC
jgi:peptidoglycan hydrolase CwlO-like protein